MLRSSSSLLVVAIAAAAFACRNSDGSASGGCDKSIKVPEGFCASVFTDSAGPVRHIAVRSNGDVIAGVLDQRRQQGGVLIFRDTDKNGRADASERFGESGVHGVLLAGDSVLYVSTSSAVLRFRLTDSLTPRRRVDTIVTGLVERKIPSHSLAMDPHGNLIVDIGAVTNGCQATEVPGAAGRDPCPELDLAGGIWRFSTTKTNQTIHDGVRIATGLHNAVALTVSPHDTMVYAVSHGRDGLHDLWPAIYNEQESARLPAEEMIRIASARADFGWPYCYYDYIKDHRVLAPEYGGSKENTSHCDRQIQPLIAFPAHWSPMSLLFYTGKMFPPQYQSGAFIAFHGSAYRSPLPQEGYHVVFLEFKEGFATEYTVFADGFAGTTAGPETAAHRPTGLAQGPDGSLYVSDDRGGRIWRITYRATEKKK
jgi:glucose/arabinose dehydrogenase